MTLMKRLEKLEAAIAEQRHVVPDPADLTRLTEDERRTLADLAATACGPDGVWDLAKLTDRELRALRTLTDKARDGA